MQERIGEQWLRQRIGRSLFYSFTGGHGAVDGVEGVLVGHDDEYLTVQGEYWGQEQVLLIRRDHLTLIFEKDPLPPRLSRSYRSNGVTRPL